MKLIVKDTHTEKIKFDKSRRKILNNFLIHIPKKGFNLSLLESCRKDLKLDSGEIDRFFPEGIEEIKEYFFEEIDREMIKNFSKNKIKEMRIRDRILNILVFRLKLFQAHKKQVISILSYDFTKPLSSMTRLWKTADIIWRISGDKSTDFNYYTKRMLLSWVYLTTLSCWIKDKDSKFKKTRSFLERRINEVLLFGNQSRKLKEKVSSKEITEKIINLIKKMNSIRSEI